MTGFSLVWKQTQISQSGRTHTAPSLAWPTLDYTAPSPSDLATPDYPTPPPLDRSIAKLESYLLNFTVLMLLN